MLRRDANGSETGNHLRALAARGNANAIKQLQGPELPEEFEYLRGWAYELLGRSGVGMAGAAPLSHQEIEAWGRNTYRFPTAFEVEALIRLDAVLRNPEHGADDDDEG